MSEQADNAVVEMLVGLIDAWVKDRAEDKLFLDELDRADMISLALDIWEQWPGRGNSVSGTIERTRSAA